MSFSCDFAPREEQGEQTVRNQPRWYQYRFTKVVQHSLQVHIPLKNDRLRASYRKGTSLLTSPYRLKASLTVEAAIAMTVFLLTVTTLLNLFSVLRTQIQIQTALEQTGNELMALPEEASLLTAVLLFQVNMEAVGADTSLIVGKNEGVLLMYSSVMGHEPLIDLVAVYQIRLPFMPKGVAEMTLVQRSRKHAFGESSFLDAEEVDYVYITPRGEVYHESPYCTYIRPVTEEVRYSSVSGLRNQNGEKYGSCQFCGDGKEAETVWITAWGDSYHLSSYCRGLWHDVEQVKKSEVSEMRACSKCKEEKE